MASLLLMLQVHKKILKNRESDKTDFNESRW